MTIDEPFEYLTFGGTFNRTFSIFLDRLDFFLSISGLVLIPYGIFAVSLVILVAYWLVEEDEIPDFHPKHIPTVIFIFGLQYAVYALVTIVGKGAVTLAVAKMYLGQRPAFMECMQDAWNRKWPLINTTLLIAAAMVVGASVTAIILSVAVAYPGVITIFLAVVAAVLAVALGIYGYIGVVLVTPAIMVENYASSIQAIKRSWELATGSRCYLLCTLCCLWFLNDMVSRLLHNMFVTGDFMDVIFSAAGVVVTIIPLLVFYPLHAIVETVMYLNLRIGRESMNHQVLSGDLLSEAAPASRFRNDNPSINGTPITGSMDYRHVPLMDEEDHQYAAPMSQYT